MPIPGTRKLDRLQENVGAANVMLTDAEVKEMDVLLGGMPMSDVFGGTRTSADNKMPDEQKETMDEVARHLNKCCAMG